MSSPTLSPFLTNATVSPEIFSLRQDYRVILLTVSGLPSVSGPSDSFSEPLLLSAEALACERSLSQPVQEIPHVAAWRKTFEAFGANPKKYPSSLEMLTKRAAAEGGGLPRVNRLTDIYNAVSVKYQIPFGGEDLKKYAGSPKLIRAKGDEGFETRAGGKDVRENAKAGEVVWCDDLGVTCRRWNWRQGTRTRLEESTTEVLFILDLLGEIGEEVVEEAVGELLGSLREFAPEITVERRMIAAPKGE